MKGQSNNENNGNFIDNCMTEKFLMLDAMYGKKKRFVKIYQQHGCIVYAGKFIDESEQRIVLDLYLEGQLIKTYKIVQGRLLHQSDYVRAVKGKFKNLVAPFGEMDVQEDIARALACMEAELPCTHVNKVSLNVVYDKLIEFAETEKYPELIWKKDDCVWFPIGAKTELTEKIGGEFSWKKFWDHLKMLGVLEYDSNRNDLNRKNVKFHCIHIIKPESVVDEPEQSQENVTTWYDDSKISLTEYMGGKNNVPMNKRLQALIPEKKTDFVEPFAGSASVSLNCHSVTGKYYLNDLDENMANLLDVVTHAETAEKLIDKIEEAEFSKEEFERVKGKIKNGNYDDNIEWAKDELFLLGCSFNALRKSYRVRDSVPETKQRMVQHIKRVDKKMRHHEVVVSSEDALEYIKQFKEDENAFLYIDPPYNPEYLSSDDDLYRRRLKMERQRELLEVIRDVKCKILLSGYLENEAEEDLYCNYLDKEHGWSCLKLGEFAKASSNKKDSIGIEYVWLNYPDEIPEKAWKVISRQEYGLEHGLGAAFQKGGVAHE